MARLITLGTLLCLLVANAVSAQDKVKVEVLKLTSSAPLFVGVEKGFFKEFGVDPELVYFQAAAPIAAALAAGQIEVGATGLTAALYNIVLGGEQIWIVADKGREWPGYPLTALVVHTDLYERGTRSISDLRGKRIGITQLGSTFHYQLGNILDKFDLLLADVKLVPLQAMGAAMEALKGKQVDARHATAALSGHGGGSGLWPHLGVGRRPLALANRHDLLLEEVCRRSRSGVNFMKGYVKSARYYYDAALVAARRSSPPGYRLR